MACVQRDRLGNPLCGDSPSVLPPPPFSGGATKLRQASRGVIPPGKSMLYGTRVSGHPRLPPHDFKENQARLQLFALAYNLGNFLHRLALPRSVKHWSLTTVREKLIKIGAKVVRRAKYVTFQMAEVAVPRELYAAILNCIQRFGAPPPLVQRG